MTAVTSAGRTPPRLRQEDITAGMTLMQTVYTVALVLGLETVIDASYHMAFSPASGPPVQSPEYLSVALASIVLLAVRFFWVPRNLNSFIFHCYGRLGDRVFTRITTIHFPIVLAHALIIYYICHVFVDMTESHGGIGSTQMTDYVTRFTSLYAGLLLLNALWLLLIMPRPAAAGGPGKIWFFNNVVFVALVVAAIVASKGFGLANSAFLILACSMFIANSLIDLWRASKYYIVYED